MGNGGVLKWRVSEGKKDRDEVGIGNLKVNFLTFEGSVHLSCNALLMLHIKDQCVLSLNSS